MKPTEKIMLWNLHAGRQLQSFKNIIWAIFSNNCKSPEIYGAAFKFRTKDFNGNTIANNSGVTQYANEFSSLGHGVFTYGLIQGLIGETANNKMITLNGLKNTLQVRVPLLMKKYNRATQYPASYGVGNDFRVEVLK